MNPQDASFDAVPTEAGAGDPALLALLRDLQNKTRRALELGESTLRQARTRSSQMEELNRRFGQTHQKHQIISAEITKQLGGIKRLVLTLRHKSSALSDEISRNAQSQQSLLDQLSTILQELKSKQVRREFISLPASAAAAANSAVAGSASGVTATAATTASASSSSSLQDKTLFEFVNIISVTELQAQAQIELRELQQVEQLAKRILAQVDEQYQQLVRSSQTIMSNLSELIGASSAAAASLPAALPSSGSSDSASSSSSPLLSGSQPSPIASAVQIEADMRQMGSIVLNIASLDSKIQHILRNPMVFASTVDMQELRQSVAQVPAQIQQLHALFERIDSSCSELELKYRKSAEFYSYAVRTYDELEKLGPQIPGKVAQIDDLQTNFHQRLLNSQPIFEEINDLCMWYRFFLSSYDSLLLEVQRRNQELDRQQRMIDTIRKQLQEAYEEEEKKRRSFFEEFGRYLPASLCPAITEPAPLFTITPSRVSTSLPRITLTEQEQQELMQNVLQRHEGQVPAHLVTSLSSSSSAAAVGELEQQQQQKQPSPSSQ